MFAEIIYGVLTNSLALISDAFHMVFDCLSLAVSLFAMRVASKPPSSSYCFGFIRTETLAAFVNALLLLFVSFFLLLEGFHRILNPPELHRLNELLVVAILGLLVNLVGVFFFSGHSHAHEDGSHDENMRGVFLHVVADTLGSVGVIISCFSVMKKGWNWMDPFVSLLISALIAHSAVPLLKNSSSTLLMIRKEADVINVASTLRIVSSLPGVMQVLSHHYWPIIGGNYVLSIKVKVASTLNQSQLESLTSDVKNLGLKIAKTVFVDLL
ncbi:hypothetical protein RCL1_007115 [Eukaryota sp. TZLM3-RCL]